MKATTIGTLRVFAEGGKSEGGEEESEEAGDMKKYESAARFGVDEKFAAVGIANTLAGTFV